MQPGVKPAVIEPLAIRNGPDNSGNHSENHVQEILNVIQRGVAAARAEVRCDPTAEVKRVNRDPRRDGVPESNVRLEEKAKAGQPEDRNPALFGQAIEDKITTEEAEKDPMGKAPAPRLLGVRVRLFQNDRFGFCDAVDLIKTVTPHPRFEAVLRTRENSPVLPQWPPFLELQLPRTRAAPSACRLIADDR